MDDEGCAIFAGVFVVVVFIAAIFYTNHKTNKAWVECLVAEGHAEYYLDENNDRAWRLIDPTPNHEDDSDE